MTSKDDIIEKLKKTKKYTLLDLANNNFDQVDVVKETLLKILAEEMSSMPFGNNTNDYKYLYKMFKYLCEPQNEIEKKHIIGKLKELEKIYQKRSKEKDSKNKLKVLNKLKTLIDINMMYLEHYNFFESEQTNEDIILYNLLEFLIYEVRNYDYLVEYLKTYSVKAIIKNKKGKLFIEEIIDKYLCEVVSNNDGEIAYLEKVIKLLLDSPSFILKTGDIEKLKEKLLNYKEEINKFYISDGQKHKIMFFIDEIGCYLDKDEYDSIKTLKKVQDLLNNIYEYKMTTDDNKLLMQYFDYLIEIINTNTIGMKTIIRLNSFLSSITNSAISDKIKREVSILNNSIISHIRKQNIKYQAIGYLDYKYGIICEPNDDLIKESKQIINNEGEVVLDCRDKYVITIDKRTTQVYDDAISIDCYSDGTRLLGIYLADVASFIKPDSLIDKRALNLSETVQFAQRYIPMLPYDIIKQLTLVEDNERRAIGYFFLLNKNMEIIGFKVKKCLITVDKNFDYDLATSYLTDSRDIKKIKTLKEMLLISKCINNMDNPGKSYRELKDIRRGNGEKKIDNLSNDMIVNYMVFLNSYIAQFFNSHPEIPFIYRNNLAHFSKELKDKIFEITKGDYSYTEMIKYMNHIFPPSFYSTTNQGHNGLNLKAYCHATNPLRKYCSLEIQRLIEKYLINRDMNIDQNELKRLEMLSEYMNTRLNLNNEYQQELLDIKAKRLTK